MKNCFKIFFFGILASILLACKKNSPNDIPVRPLAALTITNVISQGKFVRLNSNVMDSCAVNNFKIFTVIAANQSPIKAFASISPNTPYFNQNINIVSGGIYSLYLTGSHAAPEALFIKDDIPPYPKDDVVNVRIVNLSPNVGPLNITLASANATNIFTNIGYKQISNFITLQLPSILPVGSNVFQIRDQSNNLLFSYTLPDRGTVSVASSRHRNITLAIRGKIGGAGTDAFGVLGIPHY